MKPVAPIHTVELFPPLSRELLTLLRTLEPADWSRPTACAGWSVKDVAAHLLGGNLGRLWNSDKANAATLGPRLGYDELVGMIDRSNAVWVKAAQRISPEVLIEFLELTDRRLYEHFRGLVMAEPAPIRVAWAGDGPAPNWFDVAREYTEKWHHQQHIREAVGAPLLAQRQWLHPVLDTFLRGLPHAYRDQAAPQGATVSIEIGGEAGGVWTLLREDECWSLYADMPPRPTCRVEIDQDAAWRLFTQTLSPDKARSRVRITGDATLGERALHMVTIMA